MPGPIHDHDPDIVLEAERDIRTKLGDRALDFDAMLAVSNIYRAATAVRNRMEKEVGLIVSTKTKSDEWGLHDSLRPLGVGRPRDR